MTANPFNNRSSSLFGLARDIVHFVASDTADLAGLAIGLYVETGGGVVLTTVQGETRKVNVLDFDPAGGDKARTCNRHNSVRHPRDGAGFKPVRPNNRLSTGVNAASVAPVGAAGLLMLLQIAISAGTALAPILTIKQLSSPGFGSNKNRLIRSSRKCAEQVKTV